jgi:hypothetical protein
MACLCNLAISRARRSCAAGSRSRLDGGLRCVGVLLMNGPSGCSVVCNAFTPPIEAGCSAGVNQVGLMSARVPNTRHWVRVFGEDCCAARCIKLAIRERREIAHHKPAFTAKFSYVVAREPLKVTT